ncbi:pro-FMRFamide-related neuropeptide VF [Pelobates cultripes]|uniref:Pro-FMRFamide-related neuropeptide VF n=1 Tax=Pelobates cultripes TaxID=61616 RepID=A0AAD1RWJ3_PELCU|nr:pro-FMRFamide-related neuropeptide VF [Pelobates cultripes]
MEMFYASKILFFILGISPIFFSSSVCLDETAMNLESQEKYEDFFESRDDIQNRRNVDSEELKFWLPDGFNEISSAILNKYSQLPVHLERQFLEERGVKPAANLPQRFGRGSEDKVTKSIPNLPQRFGRYLPRKANIQSATNLPQRFGRSLFDGRFPQSPLQFVKATHLQKQQYETNPQTLEVKMPEEDTERIQSVNYNFERKLQM